MPGPRGAVAARFLLVASLLAARPARADYSEAAALRYVHWNAAAYCPFEQLLDWSCKPCSDAARLQNVSHIVNASSDVSGLVGVAPSTNELTHYSFGTPRTGDAAWAAAWAAAASASLPDAHFRVVHFADPVPHLPPHIVLGFVHPPREVWYNENSSSFAICSAQNGEDPSCSDSDLPIGTKDHSKYLNVSLGTSQC